MKKYKSFQSIIAIFLVLITIFSTISVAAEPLSDEIKSNQNMSDKIDSDDYSAEYLVEETEKRDENTKYFYMSDGTIQAASILFQFILNKTKNGSIMIIR